jgi:elongation factor P
MPKACDLKRGDIVAIDTVPYAVEDLKISTPSARGASSLYHFRLRNLRTKTKLDRTCKGDDPFSPCHFERRPVQFSYTQSDEVTFMDLKDFSEITFRQDDIKDELPYVTEDLEGIFALVSDGKILGIELPPVAVLKVVQCDPSIRGASATARSKPATLTTGLQVQVPEYLSAGEVIRVDTRSGEFLGRA